MILGESERLVGILTEPESESDGAPAVIMLNAGVLHRVGPNRLYVTLARRLAGMGYRVLRFDHSGVGDSPPRTDKLPFEQSSVAETRTAMDFLARSSPSQRFVLLGLCSGTLTAYRTAAEDPRVLGLVLLTALLEDPSTVDESRVEEALQRRIARSYWTRKLFSLKSWRRLLSGRAAYRRIVDATVLAPARRAVSAAPQQPGAQAVLEALDRVTSRGVPVLFLYSEATTVCEYFRMTLEPGLAGLSHPERVQVRFLARADHTFSGLEQQALLMDEVCAWLGERVALPEPRETSTVRIDRRRPAPTRRRDSAGI